MQRPPTWYLVAWTRVLLAAVGLGVAVGLAVHLLTLSPPGPPPENSDGFGEGLYLVNVLASLVLGSLGLAAGAGALALPWLSDRPSFAGFGRTGRIALLGAGVAVGAAVAALPAFGPSDALELGLLLLILTPVVAVPLLILLGVRRLVAGRSDGSGEPAH